MKKHRRLRQWLGIGLLMMFLSLGTEGRATAEVLYGFTAFPYDLTPESLERVNEIIIPLSNFYALHFDGCLPWREALDDAPFPQWLQRDWQDMKSHIPASHVVYVAVTPTTKDRYGLALSCGGREGEESPAPFSGANLDHPDVIKAYINYVRRVVGFFQPRYINIGIEISELSLSRPDEWGHFATLFTRTYDTIKASYPQLQIGAEFVLQSLITARVAQQVKSVVEKSDYLGLSFYPYGSSFGVYYGASPLPAGTDEWRTPLEWVRQYTNKPLAICETGYITQPLQLQDPPLQFPGSETLQRDFLTDIVQITKRDSYLFVVWFISVDYDRLYEKMPSGSEGLLLWMHAGLFDKNLNPKPALSVWQQFAADTPSAPLQDPKDVRVIWQESKSAMASTVIPVNDVSGSQIPLGFTRDEDIFRCYAGRAELDESARLGSSASMRWQIAYTDDWSWCAREVPEGYLKGMERIKFSIKSDREGPIAVRLEESGGEVFWALIQVGKDWRQEVQSLMNFQGEGRLEPERITRIVVADGSGVEDGVHGERTVWFANLAFE